MRKRWLLPLLVLMSLAVPALSQTIDGQRHAEFELREAYERFFGVMYRLMQRDDEWQHEIEMRYGPTFPRDQLQPPKHAGTWLMKRHFSPRDIERIEKAVSQWVADRQVVSNACIGLGPRHQYAIRADCHNLDQKQAKISMDAGAKLETQLDDGGRFHNMIQNCIQELLDAPEYDDSCHFPLPKLRRT
jgi:hypothetical protein